MKLLKKSVLAVFAALDFKGCDKWDDEKICLKLAKLPSLVSTDTELDGLPGKTLGKILKCAQNGEGIEVMVADQEEPVGTAVFPATKAAKKPVAVPAKPVPTSDDDDDTDTADDDDADDEKATPKAAKPKKAKSEESGTRRGEGVIATIKEMLQAASEKDPVTKDEILASLTKKFPERSAESMKSTIGVQLPSRLKSQGLNVLKNENGYYVGANGAKAPVVKTKKELAIA